MEKRPPTSAHAIGLTDEDCARISALYDGRFAELGEDIRTVGWGSARSQALRFEILCRGLDLRAKRILDVGCGLGDFVPWAEARFGPGFEYVGIDLAEDLVRSAQKRLGSATRRFFVGTLGPDSELGEFDIIVLSGTLTFKTSDNIATMQNILRNAFLRATGSVCINFMSTYADSQLAKNFHYSPEDTFKFAKTLSPHVALHHDYPLHEFTLQIFRQPNPASAHP